MRAVAARRVRFETSRGQNKTEAAFAAWLEAQRQAGEITRWDWSPLKLRCGPTCWLLIDAVVCVPMRGTGHDRVVLIDVKGGPWEDDAAVKIKVAAEQFAWLGEVWVVRQKRVRDGGGWEWRRVDPCTGLQRPGSFPW